MLKEINNSIIEIFQIQLKLTKYEALAFIAIISKKDHASEISEAAGIPRPKVYGAIEGLETKKLIVKNKDGFYEPNLPFFASIKEDANEIINQYRDFIDKLYNQSVATTTLLLQLKEKIGFLLNQMGYIVEDERKIEVSLGGKEGLPRYIFEYTGPIRNRIMHGRNRMREYENISEFTDEKKFLLRKLQSLEAQKSLIGSHIQNQDKTQENKVLDGEISHTKIILDNINTKISESLASFNNRLPDFIVESPNSGIRIGIMIFANEKDYYESINFLSTILEACRCNRQVIITPFEFSSLKFQPNLDRYTLRRMKTHIIDNINLESLYKLEEFLKNLDLEWIELKEKLTNLEGKLNEAKENCRINLMQKIESISKEKNLYPDDYKQIFDDIIIRMKNDVESNDQLLSQMDELILEHFQMLDRKMLFSLDDLLDIEKRLTNINDKLKEKEQELLNLQEELYSIPNENNPYNEFGYSINPFALWVPSERPDYIINQEYPKEIAEEFINNVSFMGDTNFMLITGDQGVGKSHFLNYFANQINKEKFGKSLAIRIQCKANRDILDLYPQITENIKTVLIDNKDYDLAKTISKILENEGTPRFVQDLMKILKEINLNLLNNGYKCLFIFIDEFENSLPPIHDHISHEPERIRRQIGTPKAISQLASITMLSNVAFIITFRKEYLDLWDKEMKERISKMEQKYIINMKTLSYEDSKKFLQHRLTSFKLINDLSTHFTFEDTATRLIFEKNNGNPRKMLRQSAIAFRKAVRIKKMNISSDLIE